MITVTKCDVKLQLNITEPFFKVSDNTKSTTKENYHMQVLLSITGGICKN